ncbi:hypothetical protein WDJ51_06500 [Rathayibacter sp. YIM 133350]|uniref:hypothetical protein n=1 Tax=Rathayibacter sp. YIM 133350 TaxID=3131992 RepID=UPI00307F7AD7
MPAGASTPAITCTSTAPASGPIEATGSFSALVPGTGERIAATATASVRVRVPGPLELAVAGAPHAVFVGSATSWSGTVTNTGDAPVHGVAITSACGVQPIGTIAAGALAVLAPCSTTATTRGQLAYSATATATDAATATATASVRALVPGTLTAALTGTPDPVESGQPIQWRASITNPGDEAVLDVQASIADCPTRSVGTLDPSATVTITCSSIAAAPPTVEQRSSATKAAAAPTLTARVVVSGRRASNDAPVSASAQTTVVLSEVGGPPSPTPSPAPTIPSAAPGAPAAASPSTGGASGGPSRLAATGEDLSGAMVALLCAAAAVTCAVGGALLAWTRRRRPSA